MLTPAKSTVQLLSFSILYSRHLGTKLYQPCRGSNSPHHIPQCRISCHLPTWHLPLGTSKIWRQGGGRYVHLSPFQPRFEKYPSCAIIPRREHICQSTQLSAEKLSMFPIQRPQPLPINGSTLVPPASIGRA
jgi:hypothetical protein